MVIALPKGVILNRSSKVAKAVTDTCMTEGCLTYSSTNGTTVILVKHRDVPTLIGDNIVDIGVTSTDWVTERKMTPKTVVKLNWCDTRISIIGKSDISLDDIMESSDQLICATEFPNIATTFFQKNRLQPRIKIMPVSGSTEAYVGTIANFGIECVETGATLRQNDLVELKKIMDIHTVVIANASGEQHLEYFLKTLSAIGMYSE